MVRFPLPYRVGELTNPGNSDEKLRCESATYAWLQEKCPSIPIPRLYGLGLSTGQQFTEISCLPWWSRWLHRLKQKARALFGYPWPSNHVSHSAGNFAPLKTGYLVIQTITNGDLLSTSWDENRDNERLRKNLYNGIAKVLLTLTAFPLPRIGSFRLHDDGCLRLDNRPFSVEFAMQENENIPLNISRETTFSRVDEFVLEHLASFDSRLVSQPNAIDDVGDGNCQMAGLAAARAIFPQMFRKDLCRGPFAFTLTDLHKSNIIVDDDWNIVSIIDLEFACAWPMEFQQPPFWIAQQFIEDVDQTVFTSEFADFIQVLEVQEALQASDNRMEKLSSIMRETWISGAFWVTLAIKHPVSFSSVVFDRIIPYHLSRVREDFSTTDYELLASLWRPGHGKVIAEKVQDYENYQKELESLFTEPAP